jgi:PPOX class probable F420-dependent enzyme
MNAEIAHNRYVLFSTFRKTGVAVKTPVWIAPFGDNQACFTVGGDSGKVKRLRNNPNATLQQCDVRGRVVAGTPVIEATARVVTGAECEPVYKAMRNKYKIQFRLLTWSSAITSKIKRQSVADAAIIVNFNS